MRDGYQKDVGELNLTACGFGNCNSIFLSEVQCTLPIHDFLSWRVRPAVVLLRMPQLVEQPLALCFHYPVHLFIRDSLGGMDDDRSIPLNCDGQLLPLR